MHKRKVRQVIAVVVTMVLILLNLCGVSLVENKEIAAGISAGETPLIPSEGGDEEEALTPRDIQYGTAVFCYLTKAVTPMYAPYGSGCASLGITLPVNRGVYVLARDYGCFYVYWYDSNNKEVYAYIPNDSINLSECAWTQYDVYRKGLYFGAESTRVLSGPGTINTYVHVDYVDNNTPNLMILGQKLNQFNNKLYYFIQWETTAGLAKRGWVDSTLDTVRIDTTESDYLMDDADSWFAFRERDTNLAFSYRVDSEGHHLELRNYDAGIDQLFRLEKATTNGQFMGFYRIIPATNSSIALTVSSTGYGNNLELIWDLKGSVSKTQEFLIGRHTPNALIETPDAADGGYNRYSWFAPRSSGTHRMVTLTTNDSSTAKLIQSSTNTTYNRWQIIKINHAWDFTFGQNTSDFPEGYKVYLDSSVSDLLTVADVQECLDEWDYRYPHLNLTAAMLPANPNHSECLTTLIGVPNSSLSDAKGLTQFFKKNADGTTQQTSGDSSEIYTTKIFLNKDELSTSTTAYKKMIVKHEIGHALSLTHTHQTLQVISGSTLWVERSQGLTLMDAGSLYTIHDSPGINELWRMKDKWDPIR